MIEFNENREFELSFLAFGKGELHHTRSPSRIRMFFKNKKKYKENSITHTGLQPSVRRTVALSKATAFVSKQRLFLTLEPDDVYPNKAYILNES